MKKWKESPCNDCTRVENPKACDNKECRFWRKWFLSGWEQMRKLYLGKEDPCGSCGCLRELCAEPCAQKKSWEEACGL